MAAPKSQEREGLSVQTLVIAAVASGAAAILVSQFWKGGTTIAAAMTPVVVAVVKDLLARPMESDRVRKPVKMAASAISQGAAPGAARARRFERERPDVREPVGTPAGRRSLPPEPPPDLPLRDDGATPEGLTPGDVVLSHPRRTYGRRRGPLRLKLAIVTGLLAFAVAVVVLTVPELLFGGAVGSSHSTTFFGGGSSSKSQTKPANGTSTQQPPQTKTSTSQSTTPQSTTPQQSTAPQQGPQPQPPASQQTTPQAAPAPSPSPPSGGAPGSPVP